MCVCVSILFLVNNPISSNNISIFGRREGYEFMVGPPKVINKKVNDKVLEPYEVNFQSNFYCYSNIMSNIDHGGYRWQIFGKLIWPFCERWQCHGAICRIFGSDI
jgi:hypothetical protein